MSKTILVVEDQEDNRQILRDLLGASGFDMREAGDGEAALAEVAKQRPDLILMDIQLPDISGLEAVRQLKEDEQTREVPIIAVTAFAMAGDERKTLESGCDAYVAKPIMLRPFLETVERFIGTAPQLS